MTDPLKPFNNYSVENLYSFLRHLSLTREPGAMYEYSNAAVGLLGTILQKVFQQSYEQLIVKYICDPLNMQDTRVVVRDASLFAKGYLANGGYSPPWDLPASMAGAGAIRSTARDILRYAEANMGEVAGGTGGTTRGSAGAGSGALGKAIRLTHDTTFSDTQVKIGLGWHFLSIGDRRVLFHNGATGGYRAFMAIDRGKKIAVVLLSNSSVDPDEEGAALMRSLLHL